MMIDTVHGYKIIQKLGQGGYGEVHLALDEHNTRLVAIKFLNSIDEDSKDRFKREVRILTENLHNPNIIDIFCDGETERGRYYYVMEYCPYGSLRNFVGLVNDDFALEVLKSAITALEGIFERGGFHRDIKPDNILLVQNNGKLSFKLSDFGLAHDNNATSVLTFGVRGTPTYFAPEVMRTGLFSQKADIYTLGITIIELLTKELIASNVNNLRNPFLKFYLPKMTQRNPENRCTLEELKRRLFKPLFKKTLSTFN